MSTQTATTPVTSTDEDAFGHCLRIALLKIENGHHHGMIRPPDEDPAPPRHWWLRLGGTVPPPPDPFVIEISPEPNSFDKDRMFQRPKSTVRFRVTVADESLSEHINKALSDLLASDETVKEAWEKGVLVFYAYYYK
jgi:hypothetical protein